MVEMRGFELITITVSHMQYGHYTGKIHFSIRCKTNTICPKRITSVYLSVYLKSNFIASIIAYKFSLDIQSRGNKIPSQPQPGGEQKGGLPEEKIPRQD